MKTLDRKRRRDLARRKWQFGAVALTIFLGTLAYAASYDAYRNLDSSYRRTYERLGLADVTVTGADASFEEAVRSHSSVAVVESRRQADVPLRVGGEHTFVGRLVGLPSDGEPRLNRVDVDEGHDLDPDVPGGALVERHMFEYFELDVGDTVEYFDSFQWRSAEVAGSAASAEYIWPARNAQDALSTPDSFGVLFVDDEVLDDLPASVVEGQVLVGYERNADVERVDAAVRRLADRADATSVVPLAEQASNKALQTDVLGFRQMAYAFPALFLVAAAMATYTLLSRLVFQERELIGTLRANGLGRGAVVRHYLSYGLWLGGAAGLLGVAAGVPLGWLMTKAYTSELGIPDTLRELHWTTIVVGLLFGFGTGLVSAWLPAREAAQQQPAEAMRGEMVAVAGGRSRIERWVPGFRRLPARWRMVLRGIGRNRRRSLSTILGVVLAMVLVLAAWGLIDSLEHLLHAQYDEIQFDDATVIFTHPVDADTVALVADVRGVATAEAVVAVPVSIRHGKDAYATQLLAFEADTEMHGFDDPLPRDGVFVGAAMRDRLALEEGDRVEVAFPSLDTAVRTRVAGFVNEPLGTFAYVRRAALVEALAGAQPPVEADRLAEPEVALVMARFKNGVDRESVLDRLESLDGVAAVRDSNQFESFVEDYTALYYLFVGLMLLFGGLLAFALLFNATWTNLAERATELATMRANGMSRRDLARLVVWENVLLTLVGIPIGLVAGYWAAWALMASYTTDSWVFALHIDPSTHVWTAAAMIAITLGSLWPGLRAIERLDLGSIVRQRSL